MSITDSATSVAQKNAAIDRLEREPEGEEARGDQQRGAAARRPGTASAIARAAVPAAAAQERGTRAPGCCRAARSAPSHDGQAERRMDDRAPQRAAGTSRRSGSSRSRGPGRRPRLRVRHPRCATWRAVAARVSGRVPQDDVVLELVATAGASRRSEVDREVDAELRANAAPPARCSAVKTCRRCVR